MTPEDLSEIQGNIVKGYRMPRVVHAFGEVRRENAAAWRSFLGELVPSITPAKWRGGRPETTLNLGFGFRALAALHPDAAGPLEDRFPAFSSGMSARKQQLADPAGEFWETWRRRDIWISIHGSDVRAMERRLDALKSLARDLPLETETDWGEAIEKEDGHWYEHFGFRDDISYPAIEGAPTSDADVPGRGKKVGDQWQRIRAGEFLLGYEDERGRNALTGLGAELTALLRNGTFAVFRKLRQDVPAFLDYIAKEAALHGERPESLAAKLVGRKAQGDPLTAPGRESDFTYESDASGARCPVGAHVRRANPRTSGEHRLIRRGMPYGKPFEPGGARDAERGMFFIVLNANIEEQFEFVQRQWLNASIGNLRRARDPLVGMGQRERRMLLEGDVEGGRMPILLLDIPDFVSLAGGEYYFVPSLRGLRLLSGLPLRDRAEPSSPRGVTP